MWILIFIIPLLIWIDMYLFKFFFNIFFSGSEDFNNSVKYSFIPDIFSLFKGEYFEDKAAEFKLSFFIFLCIAAAVLEIWLVNALLKII
jgi:hypothetical protein